MVVKSLCVINLNVCTSYDFLLPVYIIGTYHKCFWFAHVSSLEGKGCAHAHTRTRTNGDFNSVV